MSPLAILQHARCGKRNRAHAQNIVLPKQAFYADFAKAVATGRLERLSKQQLAKQANESSRPLLVVSERHVKTSVVYVSCGAFGFHGRFTGSSW